MKFARIWTGGVKIQVLSPFLRLLDASGKRQQSSEYEVELIKNRKWRTGLQL